MAIKTVLILTILIAGIGIGIVYFYPDFPKKYPQVETYIYDIIQNTKKYIYEHSAIDDVSYSEEKPNRPQTFVERLFTVETLRQYDGGPDSKGLYLAILGKVFDVEKGAQHYRPGGGYAFFSGRDASRAYVTGDFTEAGLTDDVEGLDTEKLLGIDDWVSFYASEYTYVGKLIGRYYNNNGQPTLALRKILDQIEHSRTNKWKIELEKQMFPPCNSEWSQAKGTRVWCTNKSGGIDRDWEGVPRKLYTPGQSEKCVCVRNIGPPSESPESNANRGDLDHPNLKEYRHCPSKSSSCSIE